MSTLHEDAARFLPGYHARRWHAHLGHRATAEADPLCAATLVLAVAGLGDLADLLDAPSPHAAHAIQGFLERLLGPVLTCVLAHGGDVMEVSAEHLVACWPTEEPAGLALEARRAAQCGLALQRLFLDHQAGEPLSLRMALACGVVRVLHVGGTATRWKLLLSGHPLMEASRAVRLGDAAEVILAPSSWVELHAHAIARRVGTDHHALLSLKEPVTPAPLEVEPLGGMALPVIWPYLSAKVRGVLAQDAPGAAQITPTTVLAATLPHLRDPLLEEAHLIVQAMQSSLYLYAGHFESLRVSDGGLTLIASFADAEHALRGLQAARALSESLSALGHRPSLGLATGPAFTGELGTAQRRELILLAGAGPLALRLMHGAAGELLCDATTFQAVRRQIPFEALGSLRGEGGQTPMPAFRPRHEAFWRRREAVVGREAERLILSEKLRGLIARNEGGVVLLEGEPGMGKTRLVEELASQSEERGALCLVGAARSRRGAGPYHAWLPVLRQIFQLAETGADPVQDAAQVLGQLRASPDLADLAPLLVPLLPLELAETVTTERMEREVRARWTRDLLASLIQEKAKERPLVLVIEDAQWLDSASWDLLDLVAQRIHPMLLVVTFTPVPTDHPVLRHLTSMPRAMRLRLQCLGDPDLKALVGQHLGVSGIPEEVARVIASHAGGQALLAEELSHALRELGQLLTAGGRCGEADVEALGEGILPRTLEGVVASRLARLTGAQRELLELASVLGSPCALETLQALLVGRPAATVASLMATLPAHGFTRALNEAVGGAYRFRHDAHEALIYAQQDPERRRRYHLAAARYLSADGRAPAAWYPLLAEHQARGGAPGPAAMALVRAASRALALGAVREAAEDLREALAWLERVEPHEEAPPREAVLQLLAEAELACGRPRVAGPLLEARALEAPETPASWRLRARVAECLEGPDAALPLYRQALAAAGPGTPEAAGITLAIAELQLRRGDPGTAMSVGLQAEALFRVLGAQRSTARTHLLLGSCYARLGQEAGALRELGAAVTGFAAVPDLDGMALALRILGERHRDAGRLEEALQYLNESLVLARRLGDRRGMGEVLKLLGDVWLKRGDAAQAEASFYEAMRVSQAVEPGRGWPGP